MTDIFHYSPNVTPKKHNLYIHTQNTKKFGNKSARAFGANIWNTLPEYIKTTTSLLEFKKFIKVYESRYIAYLATSGSKRETTN